MEQQNPNLNLTSILRTNKPTKFDSPKFVMYCSRKENYVSQEMPQCYSNCLQESKNCENEKNIGKLITPDYQGHMEATKSVVKVEQKSDKKIKMKKGLSNYRKEIRQFSNSARDLEERYSRINSELNEMKQKHNYIITRRSLPCGDCENYTDSSSAGTEFSLKRKGTQIFDRSFIRLLSDDRLKEVSVKTPNESTNNDESESHTLSENKENSAPIATSSSYNSLENDYFETDEKPIQKSKTDVTNLRKTISQLQNDSDRFYTIIEQQKNTLSDYRSRFVKAQSLVKEQRTEIEQLNCKNLQLEKDASQIIDELHQKIETKLRDVDLLSDKMKGELMKREHTMKENYILTERIQLIEAEAKELKTKLSEMSRRKMATISRLKVAERDLKIFKNYNTALKEEKRKLNEEMRVMSEQLDNMQNSSKRTMCRHREQTEKQKRILQKRIFDLEMKLNRSQSSTTSLIQERDSLIAELQSQLNNLVHNFEVSQKHIRVLRRHIYSICGNNSQSAVHNP